MSAVPSGVDDQGLLALDLSSTVGYAYGPLSSNSSLPIETGFWTLPRPGVEGMRYAAFENELAAALERWQPSKIVLEAPLPLPAQNNWRSACQAFGLRAISFSEGYRASCAVSEVDVHTARSEVMGARRMSRDVAKREVVLFCKRLGCPVSNDHVADAVVVWLWAYRRLTGRRPLPGPLYAGMLQ